MTNLAQAFTPLNSLTSTESIAATMRAFGAKGTPHFGRSCVLARYLSEKTGDHVRVDYHSVRSFAKVGVKVEEIGISETVKAFLQAFDAEEFPDLVIENE